MKLKLNTGCGFVTLRLGWSAEASLQVRWFEGSESAID
jgi:hypothetical protein